jgi:hypothetical protein
VIFCSLCLSIFLSYLLLAQPGKRATADRLSPQETVCEIEVLFPIKFSHVVPAGADMVGDTPLSWLINRRHLLGC